MGFGKKWQTRAEDLIGLTSYGSAVTPTEPAAIDAAGIKAAVAYAWADPALVANVYRFDSYAEAMAAANALHEGGRDSRRWATVNGPLMLHLTAPSDDQKTKDLARALHSSFAGQE